MKSPIYIFVLKHVKRVKGVRAIPEYFGLYLIIISAIILPFFPFCIHGPHFALSTNGSNFSVSQCQLFLSLVHWLMPQWHHHSYLKIIFFAMCHHIIRSFLTHVLFSSHLQLSSWSPPASFCITLGILFYSSSVIGIRLVGASLIMHTYFLPIDSFGPAHTLHMANDHWFDCEQTK